MYQGGLNQSGKQDKASPGAPRSDVRPRTGQWTRTTVSTFVYARLHGFAAMCEWLPPDAVAGFLAEVRRILSDPVLKLSGEIAQRRPDSILAVFSNAQDARKPDHAQRGLHAAILAVHDTVQLARRIAARPVADRPPPPLALAVGVHLGPAAVKPRVGKSGSMVHATGEAVEVARLLELTATDLRWSIVASGRTLLASAGRAQGGRIGTVKPPEDAFIDIVEIAGLLPRPGSTTPASVYAAFRESIAENEKSFARPQGLALSSDDLGASASAHLLIEGYRMIRQIGEGGMASIFLAEPHSGGPPQVLKIMQLQSAEGAEGLQRFIQEFALLAQVQHPNVARIHRQDFSAGHAYIAMEYFPRGDLRTRMEEPIDGPTAVAYVKQIAAGLSAIHAAGIVHRDLKPDNVMLRQDSSVALVDFGVAKQVSMQITDTANGDIVGTPSYLSPEQALGRQVDARSDLYSLGVLMYELLTGVRPYKGASTRELLEMHIHAPVPALPVAHAALQRVLDRLMAKDRERRYETAQALLDDLTERGL